MKSVTKIIGRLFPFPYTIPKHILENARRRGVAVHEWIEKYNEWSIKKDGDEPIINFEYQIYADFYKEWFEKNEVKPIYSELKMYNDYMVGVIDMVCETKKHKQCLVSFKITYDCNMPYCELQESAYNQLLLDNNYIDKKIPAYVLHINKMKYNFIKLEDRWDIFQKLLDIDRYLDEVKKK